LVEHIGLGDDSLVAALTVTWPVSRTKQTFRDLAADRIYEITEGSDTVRTVSRVR
jgi:hypothetical protein